MKIPVGYRFCPTDLVAFAYIYKKLNGLEDVKGCENIRPEVIDECDVYESEPNQLPLRGEEEFMYYFTRRMIKSESMIHRCTRDGKGYWRITGTSSKFKSAKKNTLVYYYKAKNEQGKGVKTNWIMHEYELTDTKRNIISRSIVLCRVYERKERMKLDDSLNLKWLREKLINEPDNMRTINLISKIDRSVNSSCYDPY